MKSVKLFFKRSKQQFECDAAPSKPRRDEDIRTCSSSSSSSDEEDEKTTRNHHKFRRPKAHIPKYNNKKTSDDDGKTFTNTTNITISDSTGIHLGHNFFLNGSGGFKTKDYDKEDSDNSDIPHTTPLDVEKMCQNRQEVEQIDFIAVKNEIGPNWRKVAEKLKVSKTVIQQIEEKYNDKGHNEVFYHVLLKWKESGTRTTSTVGILFNALWKCNEKNAAMELCKNHPND